MSSVHEGKSRAKWQTRTGRPSRAAAIAAALDARAPAVLAHLFPEGRMIGHEFCVGSLAGEAGRSLKVRVNGNGHVWCDFASGQKGADVLDLWAHARCTGDIAAAMREAATWLGMSPPQEGTREQKRPETDPGSTPPENEWVYHDVDGTPWIKIIRYDLPDGGKFFRPFDCKAGKWIEKDGHQLPDPRPLYDLHKLAAAETVHLGEGEKVAEALKSYGYTGTTTLGGANSPHKTDFTPLAGKDVVIWRDNDEAGLRYQEAVAKLILRVGGRPYVLPIPDDKPKGWDAADAIAEGWTQEHVSDFLSQATAYEEKTMLTAFTIADFLSLQIPPRRPLLSPILEEQSLSMLYSPRGVGKTYTALGIAYAVSCGAPFLRWTAPTPQRVLYVDGEMPASTMQTRLANIIHANEQQPPHADYLRIITPDLQDRPIGNLSTPEGQAQIEEHLEGVALLILDNLSTLCRSGEENAAESWLPVQEWILGLRRRGIAVLMLHHAGKGGQQRGTSKREDVLDTVLCLKRPADYEPEEGARFEVHYEKARGVHGKEAAPFEARLCINENAAVWQVNEVEANLVDQVVQRLKEGATQRTIAAALGTNIAKVNRIAKRARAGGYFV